MAKRGSQEWRDNISKGITGQTREYKARPSQQGKPLSDSHKKAISAGNKGTKTKARSDAAKRRWSKTSKEERRMHMIAATYSANHTETTSIEIKTAKFLDSIEVEYEAQKWYGKFRLDFWIEPDLVVECDGTYWHSLPDAKKRDMLLNAMIENNGHRIVRLTEENINANNFNALLEAL